MTLDFDKYVRDGRLQKNFDDAIAKVRAQPSKHESNSLESLLPKTQVSNVIIEPPSDLTAPLTDVGQA